MDNSERTTLWIDTALTELSKLEDNKGIELLHTCGRACAKTFPLVRGAAAVRERYDAGTPIDILFKEFKEEYYNSPLLTKTGNNIVLVFDSCPCPLVKKGIKNPYLCNCTIGFSKQVFETLFGTKVRVVLEQSILQGGPVCRQAIYVEE